MAVGIAYFKDGHTEEILNYNHSYGGTINFVTESGSYWYEETIIQINGGYSAVRDRFYKGDPYNKSDSAVVIADIRRIALI